MIRPAGIHLSSEALLHLGNLKRSCAQIGEPRRILSREELKMLKVALQAVVADAGKAIDHVELQLEEPPL